MTTQTPKRYNFTQVPNILLDAYDELSETSLIGYLRLIRKYGHKGCFIGSIRKLCKELRMSRMTVYRMIPVWIGSGLAQKGVQPKEDENRDEMVIIISLEALWQENTEYYAKRPNLGQSEDTSVPNWDKVIPNWDTSVPQRDNGVPIWDDFVPTASTKQGGNTSNTNSNTNNTEKEEREEVAIATARSQSSQEISQDEETVKREAVKPSQKDTVHGTPAYPAPSSPVVGNVGNPASGRTERQDTNKVAQPPAPKKPPANTIPKRPRQQPIAMPEPEPIPEKALHIMDRWDAVHKKPAPRTPKTVQAAQLLMVYDPSEDELRDCEKWLYTTDRPGKPWYRSHGVHLPDIAEKIGSWQSLQDAPKPADKDESNEHRVSSFGTPGYNFADEFYPSEAEKKRYRAAQQAQEVKA